MRGLKPDRHVRHAAAERAQAQAVSFGGDDRIDDNGTVSAFITTRHRTGYRVMVLANPNRLVIDIAH